MVTSVSYVHSVSTPSENLVNIEINYSDLNYKITQQQKAVSVPELLGKSVDFFKLSLSVQGLVRLSVEKEGSIALFPTRD